jgi:hypothetical protein
MEQMAPQEDPVELEIAAFMGPHIKRARIALVLVGIVYAWNAYRSYGDVKALRELMKGENGELAHAVNMAYYFVIATAIAGVANIALAAIGGAKATTKTMYIATGIFVAHSLFGMYIGGVALFTNWIWWLTAICLGMGFQAAWKADQLRKQRRAGGLSL